MRLTKYVLVYVNSFIDFRILIYYTNKANGNSCNMSNADLRKKTKTQSIAVTCYEQQLKYLAHICRMEKAAFV